MMTVKERKHDASCEAASGEVCKCSCGGSLHGIKNTNPLEIPEDPVKRMHYINNFFWLCEHSFVPYPHNEQNPQFGLGADVYAFIPNKTAKKYGDRNHALAIWKDLHTGEFVVRKEFRQQSIVLFTIPNLKNQLGEMITNKSTGKWEEVFRGNDFQAALDMCVIYTDKYWGFETEWKACTHGKYMRSCGSPNQEGE